MSFSPQSRGFGRVTVGKLGPTQQFTVTNADTAAFTISSIKVTGAVGAFKLTAGTCAAATLAPNANCQFSVQYGATAAIQQKATVTLTDTAPDGAQTVNLSGTGVAPAAFTNVHGVVGCTTSTLQWSVPTGVAGSWIVRNANHAPKNQHDGTRIKASGKGVRNDKQLKQFHTYHYAIWAQYKSAINGAIVYSAPKHLNLRTGRVCKPGRGARLTRHHSADRLDVGARSVRVFASDHQPRPEHSGVADSQCHGRPTRFPRTGCTTTRPDASSTASRYQVFVYAYTNAHPSGIAIGNTTFSVK